MAACDREILYHNKDSSQSRPRTSCCSRTLQTRCQDSSSDDSDPPAPKTSEDIDGWDDAALIKSYEKAVKSFQDMLRCSDKNRRQEGASAAGDKRETNRETEWDREGHKDMQKEEAEKWNKKKKAQPPPPFIHPSSLSSSQPLHSKWKLGDACSAVWSEDGCVYPATVLSIERETGTCVVQYNGYGNTERHQLDEIVSVGSSEDSTPPVRQWKVGDRCSVQWSEDGQIYSAIIRSVDEVLGTCVVVYEGYKNEEVQNLAELMPPTSALPRSRSKKQDEEDTDWQYTCRSSTSSPDIARNWRKQGKKSDWLYTFPPPPPPHPPPPPPPSLPLPPPPKGCFWPPPPPPVRAHLPAWHKWSLSAPLPPPPPPPPFFSTDWDYDEDEQEDEDVLACMLMAWYMTGYHTGFYKGLKQGRAEALRPNLKKGSRRK
ncbi:survival motor neuron protein isoform X2 [Xenopus laevis]|uniref:Survival motor neuron protein isoform X2 n=1 Tax=Xenopus laevis TaxID=8355 RepID=A0A8J1KN16_XENLA|nr:survival motor neuron protein isoform X2 [Xenopus laevis]